MALNRGRLHAHLRARPRRLALDTPSARAVRLGCEYTMGVGATGEGLFRVLLG